MTVDDAAIERLVTRAQGGDTVAFGEIFDHYQEPVYRYIASRVYRPSDAEDLTQLVFVPFGGWLFRLARNSVIDFVRTRHEHAELDIISGRAGDEVGPEEVAQLREDLEAVSGALALLTDEQREAVALRFFAGLSAREAAEAMGKQEGTVRGLQFRAIAALRRQLGLEDDRKYVGGEPTVTPRRR
jgi:RNA polymerase sigma-70 factor (ECF subfamily)